MSLNTSATMGFPFSTIASAATPGLRALSLHFLLTALSSCYVNSGLGHSKPRRKSSDSGQRSPVCVLLSLAARAAAEPQRGSGGKFVPFPSRVCCSSWQHCGLWLSSACALLSSPLASPLPPLLTSASIPTLLGAGRCWLAVQSLLCKCCAGSSKMRKQPYVHIAFPTTCSSSKQQF